MVLRMGEGFLPTLRIAGSSNFLGGKGGRGIATAGGGKHTFSFVASTRSTMSDALMENSWRYFPFAGQVTTLS